MKRNKEIESILSIIAVISIMACISFCIGCTSATRQKIASFGEQHTVEMYSGGIKVREWTSTGYVRSEESSDGYFFTDKETGKLVKVIGDIVISAK